MFWDHPRVRGEKIRESSALSRSPGSPPRARGEEFHIPIGLFSSGITPACAGRRFAGAGNRPNFEDHPRVRGEKAMSAEKSR